MMDGPLFGVHRRASNGTIVLEFVGELDLGVASEAAEAMTAALFSPGASVVVIDLHGLRYMDSTGIRCLVEAKAIADTKGTRMAILNGSGPSHRVLTLTGLDHVFEMVDELRELDPPVGDPG